MGLVLSLLKQGCMTIKDSRLGLLTYQTGTWDEKTQTYTNLGCTIAGRPVRTTINYRAGLVNNDLPMPTRQMSPEWEAGNCLLRFDFLRYRSLWLFQHT